ncbi:MAG: pyrroline-5-carboxylate reductase [Bacteroidales bacterium]|nr:pyrroline-5-carboxylate reductase [Bacteroidales bacterium]
MRITIIGAGNMGGALARGWAGTAMHMVTVTARTEETLSRYKELSGIDTTLDNVAAVKDADVIVLAVKPWLVEMVCRQIAGAVDFGRQLILSVAANVFTDTLREYLGCSSAKVFYVMPNIAAEYCESMTYLAAANGVPEEETALVRDLLLQVGKVKVCAEKDVAPGNMLSGCGIAYVMRFIYAMMEGGVEMGLYPKEAREIAMQTMKGAVAVLEGQGIHPAVGIDKVTTPGGLTIRGLNELDHAGFNSAVIRCLKAGLVEQRK